MSNKNSSLKRKCDAMVCWVPPRDSMAAEIVSNTKRIGLSFRSDNRTNSDGNCFYHSVVQQMCRPEIRCQISAEKIYIDPFKLRTQIVSFVRENQDLVPVILRFKDQYHAYEDEEYKKYGTWNNFVNAQGRNGEFANSIFIIDVDIFITSETCTRDHPFVIMSRVWDHSQPPSPNPMIIGSIRNAHFQSLLPVHYLLNPSLPNFTVLPASRTRQPSEHLFSFNCDKIPFVLQFHYYEFLLHYLSNLLQNLITSLSIPILANLSKFTTIQYTLK